MHCHVAGWSFSSLDICHVLHDKSGVPEGNGHHLRFPLVTKTWPMCILQHPKQQFQWSYGLRALFLPSVYWAVLCDVIPCSVILFPHLSDKNSFHHPFHDAVKKFSSLTAYHSRNCEETLFSLTFVFLCQKATYSAGTNFVATQTFHRLVNHSVLFQSLLPFLCHS